MKILVPTTTHKDIGPLDGTLRLPMAGRIRHGMKTVCDHCGENITDEFFVGGFRAGLPNMKFHERCAAGQE